MTIDRVKRLITLFDTSDDPEMVLAESRVLHKTMDGDLSRPANTVRLYSTIVSGLCGVRLYGASRRLAVSLMGASDNACQERNPRLSLLALWYSACTRMMYLFPAGTNGRQFDQHEASRMSAALHRVMAPGNQPNGQSLAAAAATMLAEYGRRAHLPSEICSKLLDGARTHVQAANPGDPRILLCAGFLESRASQLDHGSLLYQAGELAATIK